ncbi:uncharacterized protein LOC126902063 [Daktulosphaira vitifoliae]|uniref:uncharacterized protein LOC126902063 n=1 Tax=Daktulosphaira vitifoliae TaxID=58002 RepID=UPI0021AA4A89|nr:uncharacterized protein LOC126902063 [Daktulosphaira vitifoliae]
MSRRGFCTNLYSDNGTNVTGADAKLKKYFKQVSDQQSVDEYLAEKGVMWYFIHPSATHFSGFWEVEVKSHLYNVIKGALLKFEELSIMMRRIEVILISKPLIAVSNDPTDYEALIPGHFLIGS